MVIAAGKNRALVRLELLDVCVTYFRHWIIFLCGAAMEENVYYKLTENCPFLSTFYNKFLNHNGSE